MQLIAFTVAGYRRFAEPTSVKLHSDLVAFVGPNEAGKSSLLRALSHLNHDEPFDRSEIPRRSPGKGPNLKWQLQLDATDREAIREHYGAENIERITVEKAGDSPRTIEFSPSGPSRDPRVQRKFVEAMRESDGLARQMAEYAAIAIDAVREIESRLIGSDGVQTEDYQVLADFITGLESAALMIEGGNVDAAAFDSRGLSSGPGKLRSLALATQALVEQLQAGDPALLASQTLLARLPELRLLNAADRDLRSEYDLELEAENPAPALAHLARLADLDLVALRQEARDSSHADVSTRRNQANRRLMEVYNESWNQDQIALQLEVQGTLLIVQVTTPRDEGLSSIDERSDGLRWFAALLAFTHGGRGKPILLADEIETHLHYDAQADLVDVLARQAYTSKVLFTTHSFGCLPNDLGNGVRVVEQIDSGTSRLRNGFWDTGAGFSPLLKSMGAAAASFTPARRALIGEGPTEAIVLPTLLRQAAGLTKLGFQVAPGLASVAASSVPELSSEAGHVAFLVDGDRGGINIRKKLNDGGVDQARIIVLHDGDGVALETEDLIDADIYARCVNTELHCWSNLNETFTSESLSPRMRTKSVEQWCRERGIPAPDKAAVAQRVANESASTSIFSAERANVLERVLQEVTSALFE